VLFIELLFLCILFPGSYIIHILLTYSLISGVWAGLR